MEEQKKKVLIAGASGISGSYIAQELSSRSDWQVMGNITTRNSAGTRNEHLLLLLFHQRWNADTLAYRMHTRATSSITKRVTEDPLLTDYKLPAVGSRQSLPTQPRRFRNG
jgi:nucleoside-diphosphate-sugar epimerase